MSERIDIDAILSKAREEEGDVKPPPSPPLAPRELKELRKQAAAGRASGHELAERFGDQFGAGLEKP